MWWEAVMEEQRREKDRRERGEIAILSRYRTRREWVPESLGGGTACVEGESLTMIGVSKTSGDQDESTVRRMAARVCQLEEMAMCLKTGFDPEGATGTVGGIHFGRG